MARAADTRDALHDWSSTAYVSEWLTSASNREAERAMHFWVMCKLLPFAQDDAFRFADLGTGGGALAQAVLEAYPRSTALCLDGSIAMLERAKENLAPYVDRVELLQADFGRAGWAIPLNTRRLNAVVSYQAIHNLFDARAIRGVYRGVFDSLEPDGFFVTCDNIASAPLLQECVNVAYRARRGLPGGPGGGVGGERFAGTLEEHLKWLRRAGFRSADCPWRELQRAMLFARK